MSWFIPLVSVLLCWGLWIFLKDQQSDFYLSKRIAALFEQPSFSAYLIPLVLSGFVVGLSGYSAFLIQSSFGNPKTDENGYLKKEGMSIEEYKETRDDLKDKGII